MHRENILEFKLVVDDEVKNLYRGHRMLILYVYNIDNSQNADSARQLENAEEHIRTKFTAESLMEDSNIEGWRDVYKSFGAKPRSAVCSVEALAKRVLKGDRLPNINGLVNIYNAISLKHLVPIGGEDLNTVVSDLRFKLSDGTEPFITGFSDDASDDCPKVGEPIWVDTEGATCRRWNWRQCKRTQITRDTQNAYFVLDGLPGRSVSDLYAIKEDLSVLFSKISASISVKEELIEF